MKLVFVTQRLDPAHPTLGATSAKVEALARRFDEIVVVAASASGPLPANVRFRSFAAPVRALRGLRFESALAREIVRGRPDALLVHMSPVYALLAAPLLRPLRVPVLLWFTQQQAGRALARAEPFVDAILSVDRRSVPLASRKVRAIGHGIDTGEFACANHSTSREPLRLLSLGRYAEVKRHDMALRALRLLLDEGIAAELVVRGEEALPGDALVRVRLGALLRELGLEGRAHLLDAVPRQDVPSLLARTDVLVNATRGATADKVVFEAFAACVPAVAASPVFDALLPPELRFADAEGLARAITAAVALPAEHRRALRERIEREHSVDHWADAVLACTLARA
ncbi:MAG TPA: glycosyltransferase [Gaiellaceae bacterium]|nr:glycosyltransferase [Gaiellaceae bacterium]